ncbi:MAG: PIN domain-containing protein [Deltaproteobacteria bacterium]|nr:PIN domain-containing protein [Deltaproteobacteria bacterium]
MLVMMDTGPWVALIDRSEERHEECVEWLRDFRGNIFSSEAVLTEVLYLLNFSSRARSAALDFVLSGAIILVPPSLESLKRVKRLMEKYKDIPMDYADATLVSIAEDLSITEVVTFDVKDFSIYRLSSKQPFVILPQN